MAAELMASAAEEGRRYLRTPNFALGGPTPLELLKTAEGEQLVLAKLAGSDRWRPGEVQSTFGQR